MRYPPCGRYCALCEAAAAGLCVGCVATKGQPFHLDGKACPLWVCAQEQGVAHCGACETFPCETYLNWYNPEHGQQNVLPYLGLLLIREKLGVEAWKSWVGLKKAK